MMGYTDLHFLKLLDLLLPNLDLYQEMLVAQAFIRNSHPSKDTVGIEGRLILQLGGSDPQLLSECCYKAYKLGYDAVNLNVGCPSSRVVNGNIGAVLLKDIDLLVTCIASMIQASPLPVSVKTRIGIDNDPDVLNDLVSSLLSVGCNELIMHARRAWLSGLDPKQNREIPPLDYGRVCKLKQDFPDMNVMLNGGISCISDILPYVEKVDGFMLGRIFYKDPLHAAKIMAEFGNMARPIINVVEAYLVYSEQACTEGIKPRWLLRHLPSFFKGFAGAGASRSKMNSLMNLDYIDKIAINDLFSKLEAKRH